MGWTQLLPHIRHLTVRQQKLVQEAYDLGKELHQGQTRKSGEPYFSHPVAIAQMLGDIGADADTIIAALLHDAVEDTPLSLHDVDEAFDGNVRQLIDGVTKLTKEEMANHPSMDERIETLRKMFTLMQEDVRIMVIKLYDRLHNMQTIQFLPPDKQRALAEETMEVYVKIADRLSMQDMRNDLEELCLGVLNPEECDTLTMLRKHNVERGKNVLLGMKQQMQKQFRIPATKIRIQYEHKSWDNLRAQHRTGQGAATGVSDATLSLVVPNVSMCYETLGILHQLWQREILSFQDYINAPGVNGYRGLHTTVILADGTRVRCKIRTEEMQVYAHLGIASLCFDNRALGVLDYLPWTKRISSLSEDTEGRSEDFWDSLQSDILGESIVIHGPGDETLLLPHGATALDGAFYLFGELALRVQDIFVNGQKAIASQVLPNAASVTATFSASSTVQHTWLQWTKTGIATAMIHRGLASASPEVKRSVGKLLLDAQIKRYGKVSIDELNLSMLQERLTALGLPSVDEVFELVAEGKIDSRRIATGLFPTMHRRTARISAWLLTLDIDRASDDEAVRILQHFTSERLELKHKGDKSHITGRYLLDDDGVQGLRHAISSGLPDATVSLRNAVERQSSGAAILLLVSLWGLDPVFARALLSASVSAVNLTVIRFAVFFVVAAFVYGLQASLWRRQFKPLSPLQPTLLVSGVALFLTAYFSYHTLITLPAVEYILFIVTGLAFTALLRDIVARHRVFDSLLVFAILVMIIFIAGKLQPIPPSVLPFALGSALSFALYSRVSKHYQDEAAIIRARYPAFLFWLSVICIALSVPFLPFTTIVQMDISTLLQAVVFVLVFSILPYGLYFEIMRRTESQLLERLLPFTMISTLIGEVLLTQFPSPLVVLPIVAVVLWQYRMARREAFKSEASVQ